MERKQIILYVATDNTKDLIGVRTVFNNHIHFTQDFRYYALDCLLQLTLNKKTRSVLANDRLKLTEMYCKDGSMKEIIIDTDKYEEIKHWFGDSYLEVSLLRLVLHHSSTSWSQSLSGNFNYL